MRELMCENDSYEEWFEFLKNIPNDPVLKFSNKNTVSFPNGQIILYDEYQIIFGKMENTNFFMHRIGGPVFINKYSPADAKKTYAFNGKLKILKEWENIEEVKEFKSYRTIQGKIKKL